MTATAHGLEAHVPAGVRLDEAVAELTRLAAEQEERAARQAAVSRVADSGTWERLDRRVRYPEPAAVPPARPPAAAVPGAGLAAGRLGFTLSAADSAQAAESAFYARSGADTAAGSEGSHVAVSGIDAGHAADRPLTAWPGAHDTAGGADRPRSAGVNPSADTGHAAELVNPFPVRGAESAAGADAVHEIGIWTYLPAGVRLLVPYRHDPAAAQQAEAAVARLAEAAAGSGSWVRVTRLVRSGDGTRSGERAGTGTP